MPPELRGPLPSSPWASHEVVTNAFLAVARQQHLQEIMDPEVQIGLGVLFYTHGEFDKAKDCFGSALAARPKVRIVWLPCEMSNLVIGLPIVESAGLLPFQRIKT